jgi:hypothetical protein
MHTLYLFLYVTLQKQIKSVHLLATKFTSITKMHEATHTKVILIHFKLFLIIQNQL